MAFSDDLINFWKKIMKNKMAEVRHFKKKLVGPISYEPWVGSHLMWWFLGKNN